MNPISMNGYNYANNKPIMNVNHKGESSISVKERLEYGFRQEIRQMISDWKIGIALATQMFHLAMSFAIGAFAFGKYANQEVRGFSAYKRLVKSLNKRAENLISYTKKSLIKSIGRSAAIRLIGGVGFAVGYEVAKFSFYVAYYAYNYRK